MDKTIIGVFQSQTQIDLLKDALNNDGISPESLSVVGKRFKMENSSANPNINTQYYQEVIAEGSFNNKSFNDTSSITNELVGFGIEKSQASFFTGEIDQGNIIAAIKVDEEKSRIASGRFRNAGAKHVKIH